MTCKLCCVWERRFIVCVCTLPFHFQLMRTLFCSNKRPPSGMHLFCPTCGNLLAVEEGPSCYRFACHTCPYVQNVERKVEHSIRSWTTFLSPHTCIYRPGLFLQVPQAERGGRCVGRSGRLGERGHHRRSAKHCCIHDIIPPPPPPWMQKRVQSVSTARPTSCSSRRGRPTNQ